jgi:dTDP-4-amino-4,6-dideoxygalactose transaminase
MSTIVPFFDVQTGFERQLPRIKSRIRQIFDDGDVGNNTKAVRRFECALAAYTGAKFAIAVGNASDGLTIILKAAGMGPDYEVIVPPLTFVSSASSVIHAGGKVVFADIDPYTYGIDPASVESAITENTRAIMPVHLFHQPADLPALTALAKRRGVEILEDAAEAIGMRIEGSHAGLWGRAGVLSFFPTKTLSCFGDGGAILTNDATMAETCILLRDHGRRQGGVVECPGFGSRLDSIQAAILESRLEDLEQEIARREQIARLYCERLAPLAPHLSVPVVPARPYRFNPVWYVFVVEAERRDELAAFLAERGIGTETYYPLPLHLQPAFAALGYKPGDFPVAERVSSRTLALPLFPELSDGSAEYVCARIFDFYSGGCRKCK